MQGIMRVHFVENFSEGDKDGQLEAMKKVMDLVSLEDCDVIFCASIVKASQALTLKHQTGKPLITYCWDYYKWVHDGKNEQFNWRMYRNFLKECDLILVPSDGQKLRLKELLNLDSNVCECSFTSYEHDVMDGGYVLDPVRDYPEENLGWVKRACEELGIPYVHTEHGLSQDEFRNVVSNCTFMTCGYREASTGGLTLMEGLYNGKVSLVSNSPYMGAKNYIGGLGYYFQYDDYEDLKIMLARLWGERPNVPAVEARKHLEKFSHDAFAKRLLEEMQLCVQNKN